MEVKLKFNDINVKEEKEKTLVKVLMLKGEKGDTVSAEWGTITGNLEDQTDLKTALNSKANQTETTQALNSKANASDLNNYYTKSQIDTSLATTLGTQDIVDRLDSTADDKVLAASQGKILKDQVDEKITSYDNVASMKADTKLKSGMHVKTKGYYVANDGGEAEYIIKNSSTKIYETLNNELVAELIIENNCINIRQLGARSQDTENNKYDIKQYIDKYIELIANNPNRCRLYIPSGIWYCSPCDITNTNGFDIYGDYGYYNNSLDSTVITTLNDNQDYIFNFGTNTGTYLKNFKLENILFSTYDYNYRSQEKDFYKSTPKIVNNEVINMLYCIHGKVDNILFINVIGRALKIASCWEIDFGTLIFRFVSNPESSILCFDKDKTYGEYSSISSCDFAKLYFESTHGDLMEFKSGCDFGNNHIGIINFEPNQFDYNNNFTYEQISNDESNIPNDVIHYSIIKLPDNGSSLTGNKIESIELNGFAEKLISYDNNTYLYDTIIYTPNQTFYMGLIIDTINSTSTRKDIIIYKNESGNTPGNGNYLIINNVCMYSEKDFIFDLVNAFPIIKCNGELQGYNKIVTKLNKEITSFYDVLSRTSTQNKVLCSDNESITPLKLCCKFIRYISDYQACFINTGSKLCIRAKILNEATYNIRIQNEERNHTQLLALVGTGDFKWYEFELNANLNVFGQKIYFKADSGTNPDNALLDCFIFKDI